MRAPYPLIDIGCNLTSPRLLPNLAQILSSAQGAGVVKQILTGTDLISNEQALTLANQYPELYATTGHHPHHANDWHPKHHPIAIQALARHPRVVAVGEMGLDYHRNLATPANQRKSFNAQLEIAKTVGKPVFLHERHAADDFFAILTPALPELQGAVWHCFTGNLDQLRQALELGLYIGITGWICDPERGQSLRDIVHHIPDERLMIESDAPYLTPKTLTPTPRTNEPQYLPEVLRVLAQCRQQNPQTLAQLIYENTQRFFRLEQIPAPEHTPH